MYPFHVIKKKERISSCLGDDDDDVGGNGRTDVYNTNLHVPIIITNIYFIFEILFCNIILLRRISNIKVSREKHKCLDRTC